MLPGWFNLERWLATPPPARNHAREHRLVVEILRRHRLLPARVRGQLSQAWAIGLLRAMPSELTREEEEHWLNDYFVQFGIGLWACSPVGSGLSRSGAQGGGA